MPERNSHIILRQIFHLQFPHNADGFAMQKEIGRIAAEKLQPALEALFDRFASPEELIRIDKLEINVGRIPEGRLEEALLKAIIGEIERLLLQNITYGRPGAGGFMREPVVADRFSRWLLFLENGYLPWQATAVAEADIHLAALEQVATDSAAIERLRRLLRSRPAALIRLVQQHPEPFLVSLLESLTAHSQKQLPTWRNELERLLKLLSAARPPLANTPSGLPAREFWIGIFTIVVEGKLKRVDSRALISAFWETITRAHARSEAQVASFLRAVQAGLDGQADAFPLLSSIITALIGAAPAGHLEEFEVPKPGDRKSKQESGRLDATVEKAFPDSEERTRKIVEAGDYRNELSKPARQPSAPPIHPEDTAQPESELDAGFSSHRQIPDAGDAPGLKTPVQTESDDVPSGSVWYVGAAGIVLLHPFFKSYFEHSGLLEKGNFQSEEARGKAVHLLHFLATGETGTPEYELVLPKFLCGLPFGHPIERYVELSQAEREEGEKLLTAAIRHWNKLGSTSPQGLREGFLLREGKLEKRNENWYLSVQQQGIDILLDFLPWNLSMIKLPWMRELLRVEWG